MRLVSAAQGTETLFSLRTSIRCAIDQGQNSTSLLRKRHFATGSIPSSLVEKAASFEASCMKIAYLQG